VNSPANNETDAGAMQLINLSISGLEITQLNITLPTNFNYINNSNGTSVSDSEFTFDSPAKTLVWENTTSSWLINNTENFWFNITSDKDTWGASNLTVKLINITGDVVNEANVTITIIQTIWSTTGEFYIKPINITLNWSNNYQETVKLIVNNTLGYSIQVEVDNLTTQILGNYTQRYFAWNKPEYYPKYKKCFPKEGDDSEDNPINVKVNATYTNETDLLSPGQSANITFIHYVLCPPGKYTGYIDILNISNSSENLSVWTTLHIPMTTQNILNESTGMGIFYGRLQSNEVTYHHYFFNSSNITNASHVYLNLSFNISKDIDIFLLDYENDILIAKSIERDDLEELYTNVTPDKIYEIRIYGNVTQEDYKGLISFSTLKLLNASNLSIEIYDIQFGTLEITNSSTLNLTLFNNGDINFSNIQQEIIIFHLDTFDQSDGKANNFTFFVPSFSDKIEVSVNWTGNASYNLSLYNPGDNLVDYSYDKQNIADIVNVEKEEFIRTVDISEGYWKVRVVNLTNDTNAYTVLAKFYVNKNWWFTSSYSTSNYNGFGSNQTFNLTLTVPKNATSGIYKGYLRYHGSGGIEATFGVNVSTSTFLINNSIKNSTIIIHDNIGFNRSYVFNVSVKNVGNKNLTFDSITSSSNLTGIAGGYMDLNFTNLSGVSIKPNQTVNLTINITIDTTKTNDKKTIYVGWINFNSTDSAPYQSFNLTLKVNLTDLLTLKIFNITSEDGDNWIDPNEDENITASIRVFYANATPVEDPIEEILKLENFSNAKIIQRGFLLSSYYNKSLTQLFCGTTSIAVWNGTHYNINITIPTNSSKIPGGNYTFYINTTHVVGSYTYKGKGNFYPVIINTSGFFMNSSQSSIPVKNQSSTNFTFHVYNFGPVAGTTTLVFSKGTCPIQLTNIYCSNVTCTPSTDKSNVSLSTLQAYEVSGDVIIKWEIKGDGSGSCTAKIYGASRWYNNLTFSITVEKTAVADEDTDVTTVTTVTPTPTEVTLVANFTFYEVEELILVTQNSTNSTLVRIKNTGNVSQNVTLDIQNIDSTWFEISPKYQSITQDQIKDFKVTFSVGFPEIKDYSGKYVASSPNKTIEKRFILRVLPSEENKSWIEEEILEIELNLTELEEKIEVYKKKKFDTTVVEGMLNLTKEKLNKAKSYTEEGKYFEAYQLLTELKGDLARIESELAKLKKKTLWEIVKKYWVYILVGIIAAICITILLYMLLPPKEEKARVVERQKAKIENEFKKLIEKWRKRRSVERTS
jgi:hypothetical protein